MGPLVKIVDGKTLQALPWAHRRVTSRSVEFANDSDDRLIRISLESDERGDFFAPRHHHNFDQVRYIVSGKVKYGSIEAQAGDCLYFPEGVFYGPTEIVSEHAETYTIQTQGPSWSLLPSRDQMTVAAEKLSHDGELDRDKGKFRWPDGRVQDSYEATWERLTGTKVVYPPARYSAPILLRSEHFDWLPVAGYSGNHVKPLACFNGTGPGIKLVRLQAGAQLPGGTSHCHEVAAVISGELEYGPDRAVVGTFLHFPRGSCPETLKSSEGAELLVVQFPSRLEPLTDFRGAMSPGSDIVRDGVPV